jgi:4'-phosphopantetheinyl transferase
VSVSKLPAHRVEILAGRERDAIGASSIEVPGGASVWFARPEDLAAPEQRATMLAVLSSGERERLERFRFERDRHLFLVSHALLRFALSRLAGVDPQAWQFCTGPHGRPEIAAPPSRLRFSLSHTRALAACAATIDDDIGLDVEHTSRRVTAGLADRFFSPRETHALRRVAGPAQCARFFEYWTLKEAYLKARGLGLSLPLNRFSVYRDRQGVWRIAFEPSVGDDPACWRFWSWPIGDEHRAALAIAPAGSYRTFAAISAATDPEPWPDRGRSSQDGTSRS